MGEFFKRLGRTILELATSKKAIAAASTAAAGIIAPRLGLDTTSTAGIIASGLTYVIGQGIADHGKERAKVEAEMESLRARLRAEAATAPIAETLP